jgi:hypothetical protein
MNSVLSPLFKFFSGILLFVFSFSLTYAANDTIWTRTFGGTNIDIAHDVQQTTDSGYVMTGYTRSIGPSGRNVWLVKTDADGNMEWQKAFGGSSDDEGYSVKQTREGGYIITGYTKSYGAGVNDVYLVRTDAAGNQLWHKTFGGQYDDEGYSVLQASDGGFIVGGVTSSFAAGGRDVWMIKTDSSGNELWRKSHGALSSDGARCIEATRDGGYILTGWTFSYGTDIYGSVWMVKTDSAGNLEWHKVFGGTGADRGYCVQQTSDGGYVLTGYTDSFGAGNYDLYLIKTDDAGNERWSKTFGGTGRDYGNSVIQTSDGGFVIAGYTLSFGAGGDDAWIIRTDEYGNEYWKRTYGGSASDIAYSVKETYDGSIVFAGHTLSYGAGLHDAWLVKTSAVVPVELVSFTGSIEGEKASLSWITATELNNMGFEIERKTSDNPDWVKIGFVKGKGTSADMNYYSFIDNLPALFSSYRLKQIDMDGSISYSNTVELNVSAPAEFILEQNYPNPFNPATTIKWQLPAAGHHTLKVYDILGNEVITLVNEYREAGIYQMVFNASSFPNGTYFYRLTTGGQTKTGKMILLK